MSVRAPYHYVRFREDPLDLGETEVTLRAEGFAVEKHNTPPKDGYEIEMKQVFQTDWNRDHLIVKADTLEAFLTQSVATLLQREFRPFTERDMNLRKIVLELFNKGRPDFLAVYSSSEPEFDVE
jgi:hypothetical protein